MFGPWQLEDIYTQADSSHTLPQFLFLKKYLMVKNMSLESNLGLNDNFLSVIGQVI